MTYRRLFHYLLAGSLVVLASLWVANSMGYRFGHGITYSRFTIEIEIEEATLIARAKSQFPEFHYPFGTFDTCHRIRRDFHNIPLGRWKAESTVARSLSGNPPSRDPRGTLVTTHRYRLHVPIWAVWLLLAGCAWRTCKVMERRSPGNREKELVTCALKENMVPPERT